MYKNIVFDVGKVLLSYRWAGALEDAGVPKEVACDLAPELFDKPLWQELDYGIRPYFDIVEDFGKAYPEYKEELRRYFTDVEKLPIPREKVWNEVKRLKEKGYKLYILSNYSEYMFKKHTSMFPFIEYMDGVLVSYMDNLCKPDEKIYRTLFERFKINPKESIFFDDRPENTEKSRELGMDAITVTDEEFLVEELKKL